MMGAGNASASLYKCSPNLPSGGGNKKQGITSRVGLDNWENREIQTHSNGIGRFKFHFMNQLGGVEPGHSMFGGRWNRGDGLSRQFEQKQLEAKIKQDENNGVIIPLEKRLVRSTRVRSTPCDYKLILKDEFDNKFIFKTDCFLLDRTITWGKVYFNDELCYSCLDSGSVSIDTQNNQLTIFKGTYTGIDNVKMDLYSQYIYDLSGEITYLGTFTWSKP